MKIAIIGLFALAMLGCSGDSDTKSPEQPPTQAPPTADEPSPGQETACVKSGCSGTLCVEEGNEVVTTCEWKPEYECYQSATCERQADGTCGFSDPDALQQCIASKRGQ